MSTKIYNGWRVDGVSLEDLLKRLVRFGKAVRKQATDWTTTLIARHAVHAIDRYVIRRAKTEVWFKLNGYQDSILSQFMWEIDDMTRKAIGGAERDPFFDLGCEVSIHPVSDKGKHIILLLLYCEHVSNYEKLFKRIVKARKFEYFDNTDRPEDVSEKEWEARRCLWEQALPGVIAPVECGYGFKCVTNSSVNYFLIGSDSFLNKVPSDEERVETTTWDWAVEIALKRKVKSSKKHNEIKKWLRESSTGKKLVADCRAKVKARLPKITNQVLDMSSKNILVERSKKTK